MKFFNIGLPELVLFGAIMLVFLGPKEMKESAYKIGRTVARVRRSEAWKILTGAYHEVRNIPEQLFREAELDELNEQLRQEMKPPVLDDRVNKESEPHE